MSNIAGKASALNVVTPAKWKGLANRIIFALARTPLLANRLTGLRTLSLIHYARWVIVRPEDFPRLSDTQPQEDLCYAYEFFFSNFNGSWDQYIDSFSMAISKGLDLLWYGNIGYPRSIPINRFHNYINANSIQTDYYYSAYPLASSNDIKAARRVRITLQELAGQIDSLSDDDFFRAYNRSLVKLQDNLAQMSPAPILSLAAGAIDERQRIERLSL